MKAVLTSLNMAFLSYLVLVSSNAKASVYLIDLINQCFAVMCLYIGKEIFSSKDKLNREKYESGRLDGFGKLKFEVKN